MNIKQVRIWKFLSSIKLAIWLLTIIAAFSVVGTLIPQNKEAMEYISRYGHTTYDVFRKIGVTHIYAAWWFVLLLAVLALNLTVCLVNRFSLKIRSLGTMFAHFGVLIIFAGALIGIFLGQKGYVRINEGQEINSFMSRGKEVVLDFSVRLDDFIYEESVSSEDKLIISSKDGEILSEMSAEIGNEVNVGEMEYKVKVLRYVPDFVMNMSTKEVTSRSKTPKNPAVEIEVIGDEKTEKMWVFAAFPDMHQEKEKVLNIKYNWGQRRPKDFISKLTVIKDGKEILKQDIRVNSPLKFEGYAFFQSSYDRDNHEWSGVQVVKDPGVPIVYLGFILLIAGLGTKFYVNPLIKKG